MRLILLLCGLLLCGRLAHAQKTLPDTLINETFRNNDWNWPINTTEKRVAELEPAGGYHVRYVGSKPLGSSIISSIFTLNDKQDYSIELALRLRGRGGLLWGFRAGTAPLPASNFAELTLELDHPVPHVALWRNQDEKWSTVFTQDLPAGFNKDAVHRLRVDKSGSWQQCYVDGVAVGPPQPAATWPGPEHDLGFFVEKAGSELWISQLLVRHHSLIRLAPGIPRSLRRERLTNGISTERQEIAPKISADGRLLFFERAMGNPAVVVETNADIYVAERGANGQWQEPRGLDAPVKTPRNDWVFHVSPDGQTLLVGGQYNAAGERVLSTGVSQTTRQADGRWTVPTPYTTELNIPNGGEYITRFIDASGTVAIIAGDTKQTAENSDIYFSLRRPDGSWAPVQPLGPVINTPGDEQGPFLAPDGKTLYFSSNAHPGYGNQDIFMSTRLDDTWTNWSEPLNLGPGVNTPRYESYFELPASGEYAYLSSTEPNSAVHNLDVYRLLLPPALKPAPTLLVRGRVLDARTGRAVPGALMRYEQLPDGKEVGRLTLGGSGTFEIVLPAGRQYGFRAEAEGYVAASDNLDLSAVTTSGEVRRDLYLLPVVADVSRLEALQLQLPASAASDTSLYASLRLKPTASAPGPEAKPTGSPAGTLASLQLETPAPKPQGAPAGTLASLQLETPTATGTSASVKEEARLVLNNVFFEQGKPVLLPASFPELKRLAQTLKDNPTLRIRLEGHTDNQGEADKNQRLSEQRVAEIKKYLIRQQVAADRLETIGYGQTRPVAPNDVEQNRRRNRRVEFAILQR